MALRWTRDQKWADSLGERDEAETMLRRAGVIIGTAFAEGEIVDHGTFANTSQGVFWGELRIARRDDAGVIWLRFPIENALGYVAKRVIMNGFLEGAGLRDLCQFQFQFQIPSVAALGAVQIQFRARPAPGHRYRLYTVKDGEEVPYAHGPLAFMAAVEGWALERPHPFSHQAPS